MTKTLAILALALPHALAAQSSLATRIAAAADGEVRMTYASRPKACGDGKDVVAVGQALNVYSSMESYGRWSGVTCVHGPARVALTVRGHEVVGLRARVGGAWKPDAGVSLDLGVVPARDAAAYFLSLAPRLDGSSRNNPLLAAAIADSAVIVPDLLQLARNTSIARHTRRRAVNWVGVLGDATAVAPLTELARGSGAEGRTNADDPGPGDGVEGAAVGALAMLEDGAGMSALMEMARRGTPGVRKAAVFWLGQSDDARARALVRTVVDDANETEAVRGAAIFALGQGDNATSADLAFLRAAFDRLPSDRLKDRVLMAMSQNDSDDGARWLLARARDERQPMEVRRKAVFWAGQGHARLADIVSLYNDTREPRLREHIIFVLSQRNEEGATDALMSIARGDGDREMRKKALFWLAQKNDPRVTKLIADLVTR
jgi:HEAT repeat protein